jgi:uncharacterized Ntn-hydrolase superfamily protein
MTYGIIARCSRTGRLGVAFASYSIAIGIQSADCVRSGVGAAVSLGTSNAGDGAFAVRLLAQGFTPAQVLREVMANDPASEYRQLAILDREGNTAANSGEALRPWSGHMAEKDHAVLGDILSSEAVLKAMTQSFSAFGSSDLEERLLLALEAGRDAGGQGGSKGNLPERSAVMVVCGIHDYSDWDLRVDAHPKAVSELRRVHEAFKPSAAYYTARAQSPHGAIPGMEFADMLAANRQKDLS